MEQYVVILKYNKWHVFIAKYKFGVTCLPDKLSMCLLSSVSMIMDNFPQALNTLAGVTWENFGRLSTSISVFVSTVSGGTSGSLSSELINQ